MISQLNHVHCHTLVQSVLIDFKMDFNKVGCRYVVNGIGFGTHPMAGFMLAQLKQQDCNLNSDTLI
jgi:hypothetical protein